MNAKLLSTSLVIAVSCTLGSYAQAATTESTSTTTEESRTVDVPKPDSRVVEERTTTETKRGILGKKKETTTSTRTEREGDGTTSGEVKSRTTVETERKQ